LVDLLNSIADARDDEEEDMFDFHEIEDPDRQPGEDIGD
jgi:hypothetical protein